MRYFILLFAFALAGLQTIAGQSSMATAYDIGTLSNGSTYSDTKDTRNTNLFSNTYNQNFLNGHDGNDVFYKFTVTKWMTVTITQCGSGVTDTYLHVLDATGTEIFSVDGDDIYGDTCPNDDQGALQEAFAPGTYYIVSEGYDTNGNITTSVSATAVPPPLGDTFNNPIDMGTKAAGSTYIDTQNTINFNDDYGQPSRDVYYKFTITKSLAVTISNWLGDVTLLDSKGTQIITANATFSQLLIPGTYYIVSEGAGNFNGNITTSVGFAIITGDNFNCPIRIGALSGDAIYTDTQNTNNFNNDFGQPSNDVYYQFTLSGSMTVSISTCGSILSSPFLHLLNSAGTEIASNCNYTGNGSCTNGTQAYIRQMLAAGTYYVVSEGSGSSNGSITTSLQAIPSYAGTQSTSSGQNYIYTTTPTMASTDASQLTTTQSLQTIQYFDGLGRPSEVVQRGITISAADMVSGIEYDASGRESRKWLPGVVSGNNGAFVPDFANLSVNTNGDYSPYSTTLYEPSPLNRVTGQYGPGADWYTNEKKKTVTYTTNGSNVKYFYVDGNQLKCNGTDTTATLSGQKTTDEDGITVEEFTDKLGHKVLSRTAGDHDTYYVYDDLNNLRYVLPPLAADAINSTADCGEGTGTPLSLYGYIYHYDYRKRCIEKKLPGCDWIYMVYDRADRLILTQDGNQRANEQWTVNAYDNLGRLLYTGLTNDGNDRPSMEDSYSSSVLNESYTGNDNVGGYTSNNIGVDYILTVNYYDSYGFLTYSGNNPSGMLTSTTSGYDTPDLAHTKTLLTGTRVYHLDNPTLFEVTAIYYDKYGRMVQTRATNHLGGYDLVYNALDFTGKPLSTMKTHGINGTTVSTTEIYTYTYDTGQRLKTTTHSLNGATPVTLAANYYDQLGRLSGKSRHNNSEGTGYSYNVRSWINAINNGSWKEQVFYQDDPTHPLYNGDIARSTWTYNRRPTRGYKYTYDELNRLTQANYGECTGLSVRQHFQDEYFGYDKMGNITSLQRNSNGLLVDNLTFSYKGNQIQKGDDAGVSYNWYDLTEYTDYSTGVASDYLYDANGNMTEDLDKNIVAIQYNVLNLPDIIQFKNGNQMINTYNANGQKLRTKYYTAITSVIVPVGTIHGSYSANDATLRLDDYFGSILYENGTAEDAAHHPLTKVMTPEGYVDYATAGKPYCYYRQDHLGSIREVDSYSGNNRTVVQKTQYYPSGTSFQENFGAGEQPYKFTGKELITMHGLNWQDFGARWLDNVRMQFTSMDPHSEKYYSISPYSYCGENPVNMIDQDGRDGTSVVDKDNKTISVSQTFYYNKNDNNFADQAITNDKTINGGPLDGTTFTAETTLATEKGFGSQTWTVTDDQGNEWTLSYQANFVGVDGDDAVNKALSADPTANNMVYNKDLSSAGLWDPNTRTLSIGSGRRMGDENAGGTTIHEMGHSWGLPHDNEMPNSPIYGQSDNGQSAPLNSGNGIMSYSGNREIKQYEVQYGASRIINAANGSKNNIVKIHVVGSNLPFKIIK